jgi:hypothetical protein
LSKKLEEELNKSWDRKWRKSTSSWEKESKSKKDEDKSRNKERK